MKTSSRRWKPQRPNETWYLDFAGRLSNGQRFWVVCVVDLFSRECLITEVQEVLSSRDVVRVLSRLVSKHGAPKHLLADSGTLFTEKAVVRWAARHGTEFVLQRHNEPFAKGLIERFVRSLGIEALKVPGAGDR